MTTQEERRRVTRERLLQASTDTLVELGAISFTTTAVVKRAGLSQGALFKHFPTKAELLSATVESVFSGLITQYEGEFLARTGSTDEAAGPAPLDDRLHAGLDLLWEVFQDDRLLAAYDLFSVARTSSELQDDLQPVVRAHVANLHALAAALFPDAHGAAPDRFRDAVDLVSATMQGLVLNRLAVADEDVEQRVRTTLARWVADRFADLLADSGDAGVAR